MMLGNLSQSTTTMNTSNHCRNPPTVTSSSFLLERLTLSPKTSFTGLNEISIVGGETNNSHHSKSIDRNKGTKYNIQQDVMDNFSCSIVCPQKSLAKSTQSSSMKLTTPRTQGAGGKIDAGKIFMKGISGSPTHEGPNNRYEDGEINTPIAGNRLRSALSSEGTTNESNISFSVSASQNAALPLVRQTEAPTAEASSLSLPRCMCNWKNCHAYQKAFRETKHPIFNGVVRIRFIQDHAESIKYMECLHRTLGITKPPVWKKHLQQVVTDVLDTSRPKPEKESSLSESYLYYCTYTIAKHHYTQHHLERYNENPKEYSFLKPFSIHGAKKYLYRVNPSEAITQYVKKGSNISKGVGSVQLYLQCPNVPRDVVKIEYHKAVEYMKVTKATQKQQDSQLPLKDQTQPEQALDEPLIAPVQQKPKLELPSLDHGKSLQTHGSSDNSHGKTLIDCDVVCPQHQYVGDNHRPPRIQKFNQDEKHDKNLQQSNDTNNIRICQMKRKDKIDDPILHSSAIDVDRGEDSKGECFTPDTVSDNEESRSCISNPFIALLRLREEENVSLRQQLDDMKIQLIYLYDVVRELQEEHLANSAQDMYSVVSSGSAKSRTTFGSCRSKKIKRQLPRARSSGIKVQNKGNMHFNGCSYSANNSKKPMDSETTAGTETSSTVSTNNITITENMKSKRETSPVHTEVQHHGTHQKENGYSSKSPVHLKRSLSTYRRCKRTKSIPDEINCSQSKRNVTENSDGNFPADSVFQSSNGLNDSLMGETLLGVSSHTISSFGKVCDWESENNDDVGDTISVACDVSELKSIVSTKSFVSKYKQCVVTNGATIEKSHLVLHVENEDNRALDHLQNDDVMTASTSSIVSASRSIRSLPHELELLDNCDMNSYAEEGRVTESSVLDKGICKQNRGISTTSHLTATKTIGGVENYSLCSSLHNNSLSTVNTNSHHIHHTTNNDTSPQSSRINSGHNTARNESFLSSSTNGSFSRDHSPSRPAGSLSTISNSHHTSCADRPRVNLEGSDVSSGCAGEIGCHEETKSDSSSSQSREVESVDDTKSFTSHSLISTIKTKYQVSKILVMDPYGEYGTYTGSVSVYTGIPDGYGRLEYDRSSHRWYEGDWKDGRWTGHGRLSNGEGDLYDGGFLDDQKHGYGRMEFGDGRKFIGEYCKGQMVQGKMIYQDGLQYDGSWVDGVRHGYGKCTFVDGSMYEGTFCGGEFHGHGTMIWSDNGYYVGDWYDGEMHGYGKEIRPDGTIRHEGQWIKGQPIRLQHNSSRKPTKPNTFNNNISNQMIGWS